MSARRTPTRKPRRRRRKSGRPRPSAHVFTLREAARYLGIGYYTFVRYVLPDLGVLRAGRRYLIFRTTLDAWKRRPPPPPGDAPEPTPSQPPHVILVRPAPPLPGSTQRRVMLVKPGEDARVLMREARKTRAIFDRVARARRQTKKSHGRESEGE